MGKRHKLIIVESPAKIKTISKFLGSDYIIKSTFGHVKDLPPRKIGIEVDDEQKTIDVEYAPISDKKKVIAEICKAAQAADEVYLASDPDREGEIISWHIGQEVEKVIKDKGHIYRITFNEITKPAVTAAIDTKSTINMPMVRAQQARRILDRWVGYEVSPILWRKIKKGLSAGRVQSAALLLICKREEEIVNFKPQESWSIAGVFTFDKASLTAELVRISNKTFKLKTKKEADATLAEIKKHDYAVKDITVKKRLKKPLPPFMTSTLQQAAFNKLGLSVDRTMSIAQKLYEGVSLGDPSNPQALITYMRTDSLRLSDTAIKASRGYIKEHFGADYLPKTAQQYAKKAAQDAHEAIRPIDVSITPEIAANHLPAQQAKLYGLIWQRFMASQMTPAQYSQRQVTIEGGKFIFRLTGSTLMFDGFLKVYMVEDEDDKKVVKIPKEIEKNTALKLSKATSKQHFTQPPPRFNEASLVKEMEKQGIGRPSTYSATLATIQKRAYVDKDKKRFIPTELGKSVNSMLSENLKDIVNLKFTAQMEEDLDKIAQGQADRDNVLLDFYAKFKKDLAAFGGDSVKKKAIETDIDCTECKKKMVVRFGKSGEFLGCSGFPECTTTANFTRGEDGKLEVSEPEQETTSELTCPHCSKNLVRKVGKFGPFFSCPGYPDCKYIHQESLKMPCPSCKSKIVKRVSRRGSFWGCSGYPKCTFAIFGQVHEKPCPSCSSAYLLIVKGKNDDLVLTCPEKECPFTQKHEPQS